MKKLLVFTENYSRGGGNRYMIDLINAVVNDYDEIIIASNAGGIFSADTHRLDKQSVLKTLFFITRARIYYSLFFLPTFLRKVIVSSLIIFEPFFLILNILFFLRGLRKIRPTSVLSANGGYPAAFACLAMVIAAKIARVPVALSVVSMPTNRPGYRKPISYVYEKILDRLVWRSVTLVILNAKAIAKMLVEKRKMPESLSEVIYNGLEDCRINTFNKPDDQSLVLGCICRMDESKGVLYLLDAFALLAKNRPQLKLVLAGDGDAMDRLRQSVVRLGLESQVEFLGHYSGDVSILLAKFDIYVFPSLWEGFPYSIIEAMRSACSIVSTQVGGIPEVIVDGREGLLIQPGSTYEIMHAIERLIANPVLRRNLASNARLKYEKELSLEQMHFYTKNAFTRIQSQN